MTAPSITERSLTGWRHWLPALGLMLATALTSAQSLADHPLRIGVLAYRDLDSTAERWAPLEELLNNNSSHRFRVEALFYPQMEQAIASRNIDFILTNPAHYTEWSYRYGLSAPLATLSLPWGDQGLQAFGGVIFTRAETAISSLHDLESVKIAIPARGAFGGYRMQAYEMLQHDMDPQSLSEHLLVTGMPHDRVVSAVMEGEAEVGFVRTGLLEKLAAQGQLDMSRIRIINQQPFDTYPYAVSTRLYPEWLVAALPMTSPDMLKEITSALFRITPDAAPARAMNIHGFEVPADYTPVLAVLKSLKTHPFDIEPEISWRQLLSQYLWQLLTVTLLILLLLLLSTRLLIVRRRLAQENQEVLASRQTLHQQAEDLLSANKKLQQLSTVFTHSHEGIMLTSADNLIVEVNKAFTRITGYEREEVIGKSPSILSSGRHPEAFYRQLWQAINDSGFWSGEIWNRHKNGELIAELLTISEVRDEQSQLRGYVSVSSDITSIKEHQQKIEHLAHYDALTNLPNRLLLTDRMKQSIAHTRRHQGLMAVVFIDFDGFKEVNDNHGHNLGDQLLIRMAGCMQETLREGDTLARLGGDEFVAILTELEDIEDTRQVLDRLLKAISRSHLVRGHKLRLTASAGVVLYPQTDTEDPETLIRQADHAMYHAKLTGKNRYHFFDIDQDSSIRGHHEMLAEIHQALSEEQLLLYYQPKVDLRTGELIGAEALIRWQHPQRGLLPPAEFLPVITDSPLDFAIGNWVITTALQQVQQWQQQGLEIPVSVNISGRHLLQPGFVEYLQQQLDNFPELPPGTLEIEILETSALDDLNKVVEVMQQCMSMGVDFALDDFGTGYSSLTLLQQLPAKTLKIDRSFVRDILDDPHDLEIVKGIIKLADTFMRQVIAEGVESEEHGNALASIGCCFAQGYGIARPMAAVAMQPWLKERQRQQPPPLPRAKS